MLDGSVSSPEISLQYDSVVEHATQNFIDYEQWAQQNPDLIAEHIDRYVHHLQELGAGTRLHQRLGSFVTRKAASEQQQRYGEELAFFGIINLGEVLEPEKRQEILDQTSSLKGALDFDARKAWRAGEPSSFIEQIAHTFPAIRDSSELRWIGEQFQELHCILPEFVIQDGGLGKVARIAAGVMTIAAIDGLGADAVTRRQRLLDSIRPAYYYGITYPIIDDVLQDSDYITSVKDRSKYHDAIMLGLQTGGDIETQTLPDHPLAEKMLEAYEGLREIFPFYGNRDFYYALESMYRAQHDELNLGPNDISGPLDIYPYTNVKASLSRVVANMAAGRELDGPHTEAFLRTLLRNQFVDDTRDFIEDIEAGRKTPHTLAISNPELDLGNPFFHMLAYEAYVVDKVYKGSPTAAHVLSKFGAFELARFINGNTQTASALQHHFGEDGITDDLISSALEVPLSARKRGKLLRKDKELEAKLGPKAVKRNPQLVDSRTYLSDSLSYINDLLFDEVSSEGPVNEVIRYSLEAGGKRIRPGLILMLAESLGIDRDSLAPLLISVELAHTASLIFDDLPAQDDAKLRRGQPATHIKFPEYDAQLAGISMIARSLGILEQLSKDFPAEQVNEVVGYLGKIIGSEKLCLGQHMDLASTTEITPEDILEMYHLKTSTLIEGALVSLMILANRPIHEHELMKAFSYHAGLAFQLRDDILDATSSSAVTGKDNGIDIDKQNIVNLLGLDRADILLKEHYQAAIKALGQLDFPTTLLENLVKYFSTRSK